MTETIVWIDPDGGQTTLETEVSMVAVSQRFMPPVEYSEDVVAGQPGTRIRSVRHGPRDMVVPFWFIGTSESDLRTRMRALLDLMDPLRGDGKIRTTSPVGDQREIICRVSDGLGVDEHLGEKSGASNQLVPVVFHASDPYWYDINPSTADYQITSNPSFFPFFPLRVATSELVVNATVTNGGSVEAWPQWTIYGPGSGIAFRNVTTGKNFIMSAVTLTAGQFITIDTRPNYKTVTRDDGTNLWSSVDLGSSMWSLARGSNVIRLEMAGAVSGTSRLQLSYKQRYLSP